MKVFRNAKIISPLCVYEGCAAVENGKILGTARRMEVPRGAEEIDAGGLYLSPGFIDMHVHGGGGFGVMSCSADDVVRMCEAHARFGTTSIVPTTLAAPLSVLQKAVAAVRDAREKCTDCNILGVHLEGPFLSKNQRGAQSEEDILTASRENYADLLDCWDKILVMGAAPETDGALKLGRELRRRNILASIAHSDATYEQVLEAIASGYSDVTHIYSGCSSVVRIGGYRVPGVVEAGLLRDELSVQVIADLKHLPAALLQLVYKCKGADRISLVTDGLEYSAADLKEGTVYRQKNGVETVYEDGVMKLTDRKAFAGSVATSSLLVRNMTREAGVPLADAVKMASATPARRLGLAGRKGMVAESFDADLILFDEAISVKYCMVGGRTVFDRRDRTERGKRN